MHTLVLASALTLPAAPPEPEIPLWQLRMFPGHECASQWVSFWEARRESLPFEAPLEWREEAQWQLKLWRVLRNAQHPDIAPKSRRAHLRTLRQLLGERDFWEGRMPLPCPEHFWEIEYRDGQWQWCERR